MQLRDFKNQYSKGCGNTTSVDQSTPSPVSTQPTGNDERVLSPIARVHSLKAHRRLGDAIITHEFRRSPHSFELHIDSAAQNAAAGMLQLPKMSENISPCTVMHPKC